MPLHYSATNSLIWGGQKVDSGPLTCFKWVVLHLLVQDVLPKKAELDGLDLAGGITQILKQFAAH